MKTKNKSWYTRSHWWLWFGLLLLFALGSQAQTVQAALPATPTHNYYDQVDLLDEQTKSLVIKKNEQYDQSKQRPQIMLAVVKDTGDSDIDSYAPDLFSHWGLGQKSRDNGVLILYAVDHGERHVRIEVGYGLESVLTDALAGRILKQSQDKLKSSKPTKVNAGLRKVFNSVATVIDKKYDFKTDKNTLSDQEYQRLKEDDDDSDAVNWLVGIVVLLAILFFLGGGSHGGGSGGGRGRLWWLLAMLGDGSSPSGSFNQHGGFGSSGGFGSGGGFSGGGGSSGGGGASI